MKKKSSRRFARAKQKKRRTRIGKIEKKYKIISESHICLSTRKKKKESVKNSKKKRMNKNCPKKKKKNSQPECAPVYSLGL